MKAITKPSCGLKEISVCLAGGYKRAIMTVIIIMGKVFDIKQKKKRFGFDILN